MPIYMDRHDVSETVTAEHVAQLHQKDLKIQGNFSCTGLTYWYDDKRKTAFCLIEAPDEESIAEMHKEAHGEIPNKIIEVDPNIVESFLGRIEDGKDSTDNELLIIDESAFRTIMVIQLERKLKSRQVPENWRKLNEKISEILELHNGSIVNQKRDNFLVSFTSATPAIKSAYEINDLFQQMKTKNQAFWNNLSIGISVGMPIEEKSSLFEDATLLAERMCNFVSGSIVISYGLKDLYESENVENILKENIVLALLPAEELFLTKLLDFIDLHWNNNKATIEFIGKELGYSKSQFYRKLVKLTGMSPNSFLTAFRLNKSLKLLGQQSLSISEIAFEAGFCSSSYFSKCFRKAYGLSPSDYLNSISVN